MQLEECSLLTKKQLVIIVHCSKYERINCFLEPRKVREGFFSHISDNPHVLHNMIASHTIAL